MPRILLFWRVSIKFFLEERKEEGVYGMLELINMVKSSSSDFLEVELDCIICLTFSVYSQYCLKGLSSGTQTMAA